MRSCSEIIDAIERQIKEYDPPVFRFEKLIGSDPFKVLIAVLLSARTRDVTTVPAVTRLFAQADNPLDMNQLSDSQIAGYIYPVGFYRQKARHIKKILERLSRDPVIQPDLNYLTSLPGVGIKTAKLVQSLAFGKAAVAVDTHVFRISRRLGISAGGDPLSVQRDLETCFDRSLWRRINRALVGFGQTICIPRNPRCTICTVNSDCRWYRHNQAPSLK
jgi:endonuclease III